MRDILCAAALEVRDAMLASLPEEPCVVSSGFEESLSPLLADLSAARRPSLWKFVEKVAILLLLAGCCSFANPAVRAGMHRWYLEVREDVRIHYFTGDLTDDPLPHYAIGAFPEGYYLSPERETVESASGSFRSIRYENDDGKYLYFDYGYMHQGAASTVYLDEGDTMIETTVNGCPAEIYLTATPETSRSLITWISEEENMDFSIMGHFSAEELVEMAESVYMERRR